MAQTYSCNYTS